MGLAYATIEVISLNPIKPTYPYVVTRWYWPVVFRATGLRVRMFECHKSATPAIVLGVAWFKGLFVSLYNAMS